MGSTFRHSPTPFTAFQPTLALHEEGFMNLLFYRDWDWEKDVGIDKWEEGAPPSGNFACVYTDPNDRPYRVVIHENDNRFVYDYLFDHDGRLLEKRSVSSEDPTQVCVIVRYSYDASGHASEQAWYPT